MAGRHSWWFMTGAMVKTYQGPGYVRHAGQLLAVAVHWLGSACFAHELPGTYSISARSYLRRRPNAKVSPTLGSPTLTSNLYRHLDAYMPG
jgi:hypothetical protein